MDTGDKCAMWYRVVWRYYKVALIFRQADECDIVAGYSALFPTLQLF